MPFINEADIAAATKDRAERLAAIKAADLADSLQVINNSIIKALEEMDFQIASTPSGDRRDKLTDVNIHLISIEIILKELLK